MTYTEGDVVHIDTDSEEWGRVVGDATIAETPRPRSKKVLVDAHYIRARLLVPKADISERSLHENP